MRTTRVVTNLSCNQGCTYCNRRSKTDDPAFVRKAAVEQRIALALSNECEELILTGGEPTLRRDLEALVAFSKRARSAARVTLETNAALITSRAATALSRAGLDRARVNLSSSTSELDRTTRDPGGFNATLAGISALRGAGIEVEILATLVRSTARGVRGLPALAAKLGAAALVIAVPSETADPAELMPYDEAASLVLALRDEADEVELAFRLSPESAPPPCVFPPHQKSERLFSFLGPGAKRRDNHAVIDACATCTVSDRCSGFPSAYLQRFGAPATVHPPRDEKTRRRLSMALSVEEQVRRELVQPSYRPTARGIEIEHIVRVNFQCNQACRFCFVSTHLPAGEDAQIRAAIQAASAAGAKVVLSGGEPTLNPRLTDYTRFAREVTSRLVGLQTNAVLLDDPRRVDALAAAGMGDAFVSLHAARAETSDAITEARGTFLRTMKGIDNLVSASIQVVLNFVIHRKNQDQITEYVRMVHARWPGTPINVSFVAPSTDVVPQDKQMIPSYADVMPELARALDTANELGVPIIGFESMCGIPLCLVPVGLSSFFENAILPEGVDGGEFVKPAACRNCALESRCFGVRRRYLELYGAEELRPVDDSLRARPIKESRAK